MCLSLQRICLQYKRPPAVQETWVLSLDWEDPLEKEMVTRSSIFTWRIPWTEEPGRPQSLDCKESDQTEYTHTVANNVENLFLL